MPAPCSAPQKPMLPPLRGLHTFSSVSMANDSPSKIARAIGQNRLPNRMDLLPDAGLPRRLRLKRQRGVAHKDGSHRLAQRRIGHQYGDYVLASRLPRLLY